MKHRPVCPTYTLLQSGHVSLYAPDLLYLSWVWGFVISSFWSVLLVHRVILISAFLKMFVIKVVSLPKYVKRAHLCVFFWFLAGGCSRLSRGGMCVCVCVCVYRKPIVPHDVVDGVQFFKFVVLQVVGVQSIV